MLRTRVPRIYPASGATNYTLTADSGSFTFTGVAALQKISGIASAGSFSFTGIAALQKISGSSAVGAFTFTGVAALQKISGITSAGAFTFTGQPALQKITGYSGPGAFTFTGQDATLTTTSATAYTLTADSGSFAFTGVDAFQKISGIASAGSFTFTGVASLQKISGASDTGAFVFTGQDATLTKTGITNYVLTADAGAFVFTGQPATLVASNDIAANVPSSPYGGGARRDSGSRRGSAKIKPISDEVFREAYEKAMGIQPTASVPAQVRKAVKAAVRRHALEDALVPGVTPPADAIDWQAIMADNAAVEAFRGLVARIAKDEEDAILALLLAA